MIRVEVTAADVARGRVGGCHTCPVAMALKRHARRPVVFLELVEFYDGNVDLGSPDGWFVDAVPTPPAVRDFIKNFDGGLPVSPFSFEIEIPAGAEVTP